MRLGHLMLNDDPGAVYNSATLQGLFLPLAELIHDFGVQHGNPASGFANAQDFLDSALTGGTTGGGQINTLNGWLLTGKDPLEITNVGGFPGFDYTPWTHGVQAFYRLSIPRQYLTASGDPGDWGVEGKVYATITLSDIVVPDAFVGRAGINSWSADGLAYRLTIVSPAPQAFALVSPADNATGVAAGASFSWEGAAYAQTYVLSVSTHSDLSDPVVQHTLGETSYTLPAQTLDHMTDYHWGVKAIGHGGETLSDPAARAFRTRPRGDITGDGVVGFDDLSIVLSQFGQSGPGLEGDVNADGVVDFADLSIILADFGQGAGG
ncbi:MAG: hypothetical protein EA379_06235 [Phycisphaerales bacterium]|nr:MAG: hypothetical protein EA379_06235 [Phycisphaerales bacterium]